MVKGCYALIFVVILAAIYWFAETALKSPWGRKMRAIRDNEVSANAMGKNVTASHLQVFVIGSALVGLAGAMLTTLDGQFTPASYLPLRFTFLIWVMVIVGGSGNKPAYSRRFPDLVFLDRGRTHRFVDDQHADSGDGR